MAAPLQRAQRLQTATALWLPSGIDEAVLDTQTVGQCRPVPTRLGLEQVNNPLKSIGLGKPPLDPPLRRHAPDDREWGSICSALLGATGSPSPLGMTAHQA